MLRRRHCLVALTVTLALGGAATPALAQEQGTPIAVAPGVPDQGRAWELVTAPDPNTSFVQVVQAISVNGDRVAYSNVGPLPDSPIGGPPFAISMAQRGATGWVNSAVPPAEISRTEFLEQWPLAFDPDLGESLWENPLEDDFRKVGLFRRSPDGVFTLVGRTQTFERMLGASTDLHDFVFLTESHLLPADTHSSGEALYEVVGTDLRLIGVDAGGTPISPCGEVPGPATSISDDGKRIFFTTAPCGDPSQVYLQGEGGGAIEISAPQCVEPDCEGGTSTFLGATPSGSSAFFVSSGKLTAADANSHNDLYRYDVASGDLNLLSSGGSGPDVTAIVESVQTERDGSSGVVQPSADGSRVYFAGETEGGGGAHMYLADDGGRRLVPGTDSTRFTQTAGDGRYLVFTTAAPLTAADTDASPDVYRYDAEDGSVALVSTGPLGGNGPFIATLNRADPYVSVVTFPHRVMSGDGSRIFFVTSERLVAADRNEADDVYEWANGRVGLISAGTGEQESVYLGMSGDGGTVFFKTNDVLLSNDRDGGDADIYAARIGGGFPAAPGQGCTEACGTTSGERARRPVPASSLPRRGGIGVAGLAAAGRRAAASGWIVFLAEVPRGGHLSTVARARIGSAVRAVATVGLTVAQPGPVRVRLRLSARARRALAAGHDLRARLSLRLSGHGPARHVNVKLRGSR